MTFPAGGHSAGKPAMPSAVTQLCDFIFRTEESSSDDSSSSESGDEPFRTPQCPRKADLSSPEPSSTEPGEDSDSVSDEELPGGPHHSQEPSKSGSEASSSVSEASSSGLEPQEDPSPDAFDDSQSMSKSSTEPSSSSESEDSPAASLSQPASTASSSEASDSGSEDSQSRACSMDAPPGDLSEADSGRQERSTRRPALIQQISSTLEPEEDSPTREISESAHASPEPAENAGSGRDVPAGEDIQQGSSLERPSSAEGIENAARLHVAATVQEEPSKTASHNTDAAEHSESEISAAIERLSSSSQHHGAEAQQAAAFAKPSQGSILESAVLPEPKQSRSIFQRCTAALTGEQSR